MDFLDILNRTGGVLLDKFRFTLLDRADLDLRAIRTHQKKLATA